MKRLSISISLALSFFALAFTGCQTQAPSSIRSSSTNVPVRSETQLPVFKQVPAPITVVSKASTPVPSSNTIFKSNQIEVKKTVLEPASVGGLLKYRISITARDDVDTVRVTETIPNGVQFSSATPAGSRIGNDVKWVLTSMKKGQTQNIDIIIKPTSEGDHQTCSIISVDNSFCLPFFAGQPKLDVVKVGPKTIELGEEAEWSVTVTNSGSAAATNVVVTDKLPDAFTPTSDLRQPIGDLSPGETRTVNYTAKAVKQGKFSNRAVASYDGSGPDGRGSAGSSPEASSPITIVQSGIRVRKTGPAEAYVFKPVPFEITIENTGDTDLKNIRITDILPKGASVTDNGRGRVSGNAIGWMIPNLPAGSSQLIKTEIAATRKGESTNTVNVLSANGLEASDSVTTNWLAVPGVTVSITDSKDPIRVLEATIYSIQVRNQGDFEPVSGTVTVTFNDSIKPTSVAGDAQGTINGQTVTFPRTTLEPGKDTNLSITAEGAKIGPGRAIMNFSADFLSDPIISQETTNVY